MKGNNIFLDGLEEGLSLEVLARQVVEGFITGLHKSPFHGFSVEFAEHKLYNQGESVKHVDWKLFARTDKMFVKKFEEETNLRCHLVLDSSSSMFYPEEGINKFQYSSLAIASIINLLQKQRDAFGLTLFSDVIESHIPAKSTRVHEKIIYHELERYLNKPVRGKLTNITECLHTIAERLPKRSMVVVFSDFFSTNQKQGNLEEVFSALQHLRFNKHEVIIFNVLDKTHELDFSFENRPYHFIDSETGKELKLNPSHYINQYKSKMDNFKKEIDTRCGQLKIDLVDAYLEEGFNATLNAWLIKRNKMG